MKKLFLLLAFIGAYFTAPAESKVATIHVKASIYCDHCNKCESCGGRLKDAIYGEKGVKRVDINEEEKTVSIVYNTNKTDVDKLRKAITDAGFDADGIKGDPEAYATWDDCCKKQ